MTDPAIVVPRLEAVAIAYVTQSISTLQLASTLLPSPIISLSLTTTAPPGQIGCVDPVAIVFATFIKYFSLLAMKVGSPSTIGMSHIRWFIPILGM